MAILQLENHWGVAQKNEDERSTKDDIHSVGTVARILQF
jgi:hypothetical protein